MAKRIGKYKVSKREAALSAIDGGVVSGNLSGIGTLATTGIVSISSGATTGFKNNDFIVPCIPDVAQQALSGAGACNVTAFYTAVTTTGADALTLAAGTELGQLKKIQMIVDGGDGTLTISDPVSSSLDVITLADAGDYVLCIWNGTAWRVLELGNDADGASAPGIA